MYKSFSKGFQACKRTCADIVSTITLPYRHIRAVVAYTRAVNEAEELKAKHNDRIYVIKAAGRRLLCINKKTFKRMRNKGYFRANASVKDLEQNCFYCTTYANGKDAMPPEVVAIKRKQAIRYLSGRPYRVFRK